MPVIYIYAGHCDIFVTADTKLRGKAEAMYRKYKYQTRILHPKEFESFIDKELQHEYSLKYLSEVINKYGIPRMEEDGAHYTLLPTQIFGLFNTCHKLDKFWGYDGETANGLFRYSFNNTPYLFFDEISNFCNFVNSFIPTEHKATYLEEYVKPLISGDKDKTKSAHYTLNCPDMDFKIYLTIDSLVPVPCPMMLFIHGEQFENMYEKVFCRKEM